MTLTTSIGRRRAVTYRSFGTGRRYGCLSQEGKKKAGAAESSAEKVITSALVAREATVHIRPEGGGGGGWVRLLAEGASGLAAWVTERSIASSTTTEPREKRRQPDVSSSL